MEGSLQDPPGKVSSYAPKISAALATQSDLVRRDANHWTVFFAPLTHRVHHGRQALAEGRQRVLDLRRHLCEDFPPHESVALHLPELLRQDFLRDPAQLTSEFGEALGPREEVPEDQHLPSAFDHVQRGLGRTLRLFSLHQSPNGIAQVTTPLICAYFTVRNPGDR